MAKEKYERMTYLGPVSAFSVVKGGKSADRALVTGVTYDDLPADHPVIQNLTTAKLLFPEASPAAAVSDSDNDKGGGDRSTSAKSEGKAK